jgi:hypothetical protein
MLAGTDSAHTDSGGAGMEPCNDTEGEAAMKTKRSRNPIRLCRECGKTGARLPRGAALRLAGRCDYCGVSLALPPLDLRAGMMAVRHIDARIAGKRPRWPGLTVTGR